MQVFKDFIQNKCTENFQGYQPRLHMLYSDYSNAMLPDKLQQLLAQKREMACSHARAWAPCIQKP
jgi:hypothetical protein